ncbi:hypothetical protein Tco_0927516 [Tanacetum coccineum]
MKYEEIIPIFERVWDQNQAFVPKDSEIEKVVMKRSEDAIPEQVVKESSRKAKGRLKRKASKPRKDKDKRQKKQDDPEKLMEYVEVISDSEEVISVTPLAVKSLIVGWKSYCKEDVGYYEIHRADRSYKTYIFFSQMLNDFDKEDLIVLYRLFNENQELIEWKLYDSCGVHSLMLGEVRIHMLVEKKYPLPQDTLPRMLRWKLHVNYNVTQMAYELLRPKLLTPRTISSRLVPTIPSSTQYVPPTKNGWEILFQPMFDEYLNPPPCVDPQVLVVIAPEPAISTSTSSSTIVDQDAPSSSTSQTT